jgi:hypothetical protein
MHNDYHLLGEAYQQIFENVYLPGPQSFGGKKKTGEKGEEECGKGCTCGECEHCTPEYVEKHLGNAEDEEKKSKHSRGHYEGAVHVIHHILKSKKEDEENLPKHMEAHMKKIYGSDYDPKKAAGAIKKALGSKSEDEQSPSESRRADMAEFRQRDGRDREDRPTRHYSDDDDGDEYIQKRDGSYSRVRY